MGSNGACNGLHWALHGTPENARIYVLRPHTGRRIKDVANGTRTGPNDCFVYICMQHSRA
eukprot:437516-Lingulodinium_polyedra.AAC.1